MKKTSTSFKAFNIKTISMLVGTLIMSSTIMSSTVQAETSAEPMLNEAKDRITDQAIRADQATYTATQARIHALNETCLLYTSGWRFR